MAGLTTSHAVRPLSAAERKRVSLLNPERAFSKVISTQAKCRSRKSLKVLKVSAIGPGKRFPELLLVAPLVLTGLAACPLGTSLCLLEV